MPTLCVTEKRGYEFPRYDETNDGVFVGFTLPTSLSHPEAHRTCVDKTRESVPAVSSTYLSSAVSFYRIFNCKHD
jgi:hypothetical protein